MTSKRPHPASISPIFIRGQALISKFLFYLFRPFLIEYYSYLLF
jgi:hypothetical protein